LTRRRPWLGPFRAALVALGGLLLLNQVAGRWAPPPNPEPIPYWNQWPLELLGLEHSGMLTTAMGDPIPPRRPGGPLRILLLGSSAMWGGGLVRFQSIPWHLQRLLQEEGVAVTTINGGMPGSDSGQQLLRLLEGLEKLQPDIVVHYGGNNEFFGVLIYKQLNPHWSVSVEKARVVLDHLALYRLLATHFRLHSPPRERVGLAVFQVSSAVTRGDVALVESRYERNLTRMGEACAARGVPLVLCSVAVNETFPPKAPFPQDAPALQVDLRAAFKEGRLVGFLDSHSRQHPDQAWARFALGQLLLEEGRELEAKGHLTAAVELDPVPVRALPSQSGCVERAARDSGSLFLDVPAILHRHAGPVLGKKVFLDQCHLLAHSNRLVAQELIDLLKSRGLVPAPSESPWTPSEDSLDLEAFQGHDDIRQGTGRTPREWDCLPADLVQGLGWDRFPAEYQDGHVATLRLKPPADELHLEALKGHLAYLGLKSDLAIQHYRKALALAPGRVILWRNLGHALAQAGKLGEALDCWGEFLRRGGHDPHLVELLRSRRSAIQDPVSPGAPSSAPHRRP